MLCVSFESWRSPPKKKKKKKKKNVRYKKNLIDLLVIRFPMVLMQISRLSMAGNARGSPELGIPHFLLSYFLKGKLNGPQRQFLVEEFCISAIDKFELAHNTWAIV